MQFLFFDCPSSGFRCGCSPSASCCRTCPPIENERFDARGLLHTCGSNRRSRARYGDMRHLPHARGATVCWLKSVISLFLLHLCKELPDYITWPCQCFSQNGKSSGKRCYLATGAIESPAYSYSYSASCPKQCWRYGRALRRRASGRNCHLGRRRPHGFCAGVFRFSRSMTLSVGSAV